MAEKETVTIQNREKFYRGKSMDFLRTLDVRECAKYMPSRSRRSILRNFDVVEKFVKSCQEKAGRKRKIRTHLRDIIIVPALVGMRIGIHNGRKFEEIEITSEMIGHRLGEFSHTRVKVTHSSAGIGATKGSKAAKK